MNDSNLRSDLESISAEKKAYHNKLERKRRDTINDNFETLKICVPSLNTGQKFSRAQILRETSKHLTSMKIKNETHRKDIEDLKRQNSILEQQIKILEKTKAKLACKQNNGS